jgi:hypothetical protein
LCVCVCEVDAVTVFRMNINPHLIYYCLHFVVNLTDICNVVADTSIWKHFRTTYHLELWF